MKARISARDMIARISAPRTARGPRAHPHAAHAPAPAPRASRASARSVDQLTDSERLRITRFVARFDHENPGATAWLLEVYGFGSSVPLARQSFGMPVDRADQPAALDEVLASLSLVRWGACMADAECTRVEGCCVQDFAAAPQRTLSARHAA